MTVVIKENYGRLGNNILQLICALKYALDHEINIDLFHPKSRFIMHIIDLKQLQSMFPLKNVDGEIEIQNYFHDHRHCPSYEKIKNVRDYLISCLNWNLIKSPYIINWDCTLLIHFRSGDIFSSIGNSHPYYSQPPWGFYLKIFEDYYQSYPFFLIMAEDKQNPLIDKILQLNSDELWKSRNVQFIYFSNCVYTDIKTFLDAPQLVLSNSTFAYSLLALKPNLKTSLIIGCKQTTFIFNDCPYIQYYNLLDDYPLFNEWKYTAVQRDLLLNYPMNRVIVDIK